MLLDLTSVVSRPRTLQAKSMTLRPQASKDMGSGEAQRHARVVDEYRELAELQLKEMEKAEGERAAELLREGDSGRGGGDGKGGGGGQGRPPGSWVGGIWGGMSVSKGAHVVDILASDGLDKAAGESGTVQPVRPARTPVRPATSPSKKREGGGGEGEAQERRCCDPSRRSCDPSRRRRNSRRGNGGGAWGSGPGRRGEKR